MSRSAGPYERLGVIARCVHDVLAEIPMLLVHGDRDEILPPFASEVVHHLAGGHGELVIVPGAGHLLTEAATTCDPGSVHGYPTISPAPAILPVARKRRAADPTRD